MSFYLGDLPLANNTPISAGNVTIDNFLTSAVGVYNTFSNCHFVRVNIVHIFGHDKFRFFVTIFGTQTVISNYTHDNDGFI